ncbi:MAG TPA: hypothetical protein GXX28_03710 [Firmicutes bacterium]|nr:hypothetical protein [Bacillota bacterium]
MKLKASLALLLTLILGAGAALPAAAQTSISVTVTTSDPKTMAGLLIGGLMGAFFGAQSGAAAPTPAPPPQPSAATVLIQQPQPADPWSDLPVWYVASWADVPVERIIELRRSGHRWVEIVERYRLPAEFRGHTVIITEPGHGRGRKKVKQVFVTYTDEEFERFVFVRFLEEYYAVPRATIVVWLDRGLSLHDIFLSVNLATRLRVQPDVIIRYRLAGEPWDYIARRYRVSVVELGRPVIVERKARHRVRFEHRDWDDHHGDD